MADNVLQTLQRLIQDVIAPDVRELKVRVAALDQSMNERFSSVNDRFTSLEKQSEAQFKAIMAAISESRAQTELAAAHSTAALRERIAALEARRQ